MIFSFQLFKTWYFRVNDFRQDANRPVATDLVRIWKLLQYVAPKQAEKWLFSLFWSKRSDGLPSMHHRNKTKLGQCVGVSFIWSNSYCHRDSSCPRRWAGGFPTSRWWSRWSPESPTVETREGWLPNWELRGRQTKTESGNDTIHLTGPGAPRSRA